VYRIGSTLWDGKVGAIAGMASAVHPFLIWYSSRIWVEVWGTLLFTAIIASLALLHERPSRYAAALLGLSLGAACLTKGTFLPLVVAVPVSVLGLRPRIEPRLALLAAVISLVVIAPWTIRNWRVTGTFIPVHGHMGFNIHIGDSLIAHFSESPYAITPLWERATAEAAALTGPELAGHFDGWRAELAASDVLLKNSMQRYLADPLFLPRKIVIHAATFWAWSDTKPKTIAIAALQAPLLIVFLLAMSRLIKQQQYRDLRMTTAVLVLLYYAGHLPVLAIGRYSAALTPVMLTYSAAFIFGREKERSCEQIPATAETIA
jgi:4-amino-4-deoxy-L-arabinose transferase-like glycosyltransferase